MSQERIPTLGAIFSEKDVRDYKAVCKVSNKQYPDEFELELDIVKNQGSISSCVAHGLSTVIEYFNKKETGKSTRMSTAYIYGNRNTSILKGEGMIIRDALAALRLYGDVSNNKFPGNTEVPEAIKNFNEKCEELYEIGYKNRISSYFRINDEDTIKECLMNNGPVVIGMTWYSDIRVRNGIMTSTCEKKNSRGGHCMVIYGWNSDGWKIQNSWGKHWGIEGRAIIPYDMEIKEIWGVTDDIIEGVDIVKPYSSDIGKVIAKVLNLFWKLFIK